MIKDKNSIIKELKTGKVVGVPTDTVYGFATLPEYSEKIYQLKKRNKEKKLIMLISNYEKLEIEDSKLIEIFKRVWPGATTLIFEYQGEKQSFRVPAEPNLIALIEEIGPLYVTSANLSGEAPITSSSEFIKHFPQISLLIENIQSEKSTIPSEIYYYEKGKLEQLR